MHAEICAILGYEYKCVFSIGYTPTQGLLPECEEIRLAIKALVSCSVTRLGMVTFSLRRMPLATDIPLSTRV
jgi:hypothetical protein